MVYHLPMGTQDQTFYTYASPHGPLTLGSDGEGITEVVFGESTLSGINAPSALTNKAATQIQEYLAGRRREFDIPLTPRGTPFQLKVWEVAGTIPYGETLKPQEVAALLQNPQGYRAVGAAARRNRLAPFIPTHRILLSGSADSMGKLMRAFIALEQRVSNQS